MTDWDDDSPQLRANLDRVIRDVSAAAKSRTEPTAELARQWHREIMLGLEIPHIEYLGRFRGDSSSPRLRDCRVAVFSVEGEQPENIAVQIRGFEEILQAAISRLDDLIPPGSAPGADSLRAIIQVCGWVHAEWIRIHPFANGNGRTARLWANFVALRYDLPPFIQLRPRPSSAGYALAARAAMLGNPEPTAKCFASMLQAHLRNWEESRPT